MLTKNIALIVTEQIILSQLVVHLKEQRDDEDKKILMQDQNLLRNHLYHTFVLPQMTEQNNMIHEIEIEVYHGIIIFTVNNNSQNRYRSTFTDRLSYGRTLLLHNTLDQDMTIINETRDFIALLIDLPSNLAI